MTGRSTQASTDMLAHRQVMRWEYARERWGDAKEKVRQRPTITISRSFGAQGLMLARVLGERLGLPVYDKDIVKEIASRARVAPRSVTHVDERIENVISAWIGDLFADQHLSRDAYMGHLSHFLLTVAYQASSVLVGRGANLLLHPDRTLRVRMVAPRELRIKRIASRHKLYLAQATALVDEIDEQRAAFVRTHFDRDVTAAEDYDLVLNTEVFSLKTCMEMIEHAFRTRFPQVAPSSQLER